MRNGWARGPLLVTMVAVGGLLVANCGGDVGGDAAREAGGTDGDITGGAGGVAGGTGGDSTGDAGRETGGEGGDSTGGAGGDSTGGAGGVTGGCTDFMTSPAESCDLGVNYDLCEFRLLNNQWGSMQGGVSVDQCIFVNADGTYGWRWNRGLTGQDMPNYPEVEFGINPWGQARQPWEVAESSTDALPIQLRDIQSATMTFGIDWDMGDSEDWDLAFEMWLVDGDPRDGGGTVVAEAMAFFGWSADYWPLVPVEGVSGAFHDGYNGYTCYQDTTWTWQYIQFRVDGGSRNPPSLDHTFDIKAYVDWLVNTRGFSSDLWVSRFELGSEVYDISGGSVTIRALAYEVNGETYASVPALQ